MRFEELVLPIHFFEFITNNHSFCICLKNNSFSIFRENEQDKKREAMEEVEKLIKENENLITKARRNVHLPS